MKHYIKINITQQRTKMLKENSPVSRGNSSLKNWTNVQKWGKMAYYQMLPCVRSQNYSKIVMFDLLNRFYEDEEESKDAQIINVKAMYKYLMDCMAGEVPAVLPPKESKLLLILMKQLKDVPNKFDFQEEMDFMRKYRQATSFTPFKVKDEFKKQAGCSYEDQAKLDPNSIPIPEDLYAVISRHKKVVQSFNPLMVPLWMLSKEQGYFKKIFNISKSNRDLSANIY
ncbi:uncharacterized protein LOC118205526 isoform X2 [Stegodyphus dumicola]|uniref:uncharacterized protein LOC118205526 isoform X2 n=1 Tax=Stegodyphus dumicola TaxID=202533 RepID=UPI0015AD51F4|nr:uncharacterized protein LOC118205526 isoform X2 [Stegodyphus dumicola]